MHVHISTWILYPFSYRCVIFSLHHRLHPILSHAILLHTGKCDTQNISWNYYNWRMESVFYFSLHAAVCFRNISNNVMATLRLVFRVTKFQIQFTKYTDRFLQEQIQYGFRDFFSQKPLTIPEFGEIQSIIFLGKSNIWGNSFYTFISEVFRFSHTTAICNCPFGLFIKKKHYILCVHSYISCKQDSSFLHLCYSSYTQLCFLTSLSLILT